MTESELFLSVDRQDSRILALVQQNNRRSCDDLADELNMSASAVRRRLAKLRENGVISRDVSIVDPGARLITVITSIRVLNETRGIYAQFKELIESTKEVAQCYTVSGDSDFVIIAHFANLPAYEEWIESIILDNDDFQRSDTKIVYSRLKYETAIVI